MNIFKFSKYARAFIYISLFTPLLIVPSTVWEYVFTRSLVFYCLAAAALILSAAVFWKQAKQQADFKLPFLFWLVAAFAGIRCISGIFGADPAHSFWGLESRMDGNFGYLTIFGWFAALLLVFDEREKWEKLFKVSVSAALIAAAFAVIQAFFPDDSSFIAGKAGNVSFFSHRLAGSLGNPIFLAGYLLPHIFLSLHLAWRETVKKKKFFWLGAASFLFFVFVLTHTRGAVISLFISVAILLLAAGWHYLKRDKKLFWKLFYIALPVSIGTLAVFAFVFGTKLEPLKNMLSLSGTVGTRLMLWKIGLLGFWDKWLLGWGPENFSYAFSKFYNPELLKFSFYETWADKPHNQFIEILSTTGILGFAAFAGIVILSLRACLRLAKKDGKEFWPYLFIGGALLSYLGHIFFAFDTLESRLAFFMLLGFLVWSEGRIFGGRRVSAKFFRIILAALILAAAASLWFVPGAVTAAHYAQKSRDALLNNKYSDSSEYFKKLKNACTPYAADNWEMLADDILKADALGRLPATTLKEILPAAISGLEAAANKSPESFSYHFRLGQMYNLAGIYLEAAYLDKSAAELKKASSISPERQVADLTLAQVLYYKRDRAAAVKVLEDLVAKNENIIQPYWYLGIFYQANGETDKAYAFMTTAADRGYAPQILGEWGVYLEVLSKYKDYARMAPVYKTLLEGNPDNAGWWANLAVVYLELDKFNDARNAARQAIFLDPKFGDEGEKFLQKVDKKEYGG